MTILNSFGLVLAVFLLAIIPGPGVFTTVSKAMVSGFKGTIPTIIGIVFGDIIFLTFAIFGLYLIAEMFNGLFIIIKYIGGAYLIYLGVKLWRSQQHHDISFKTYSKRIDFLSGLSVTLANPKVIVFYIGFLPTFVNFKSLSNYDIFLIVAIVSITLGTVLMFYAYSAAKVSLLFKTNKAQNILSKIGGSIMVCTGLILWSKNN